MKDRNGLFDGDEPTRATGAAERVARRGALADDRACDIADFLMKARELNATPDVARNAAGRRSAIDGRTVRHKGCADGRRLRKRIEELFGRGRAAVRLRKTKFRDLDRLSFAFTLAAAAHDLVRLRKLLAA